MKSKKSYILAGVLSLAILLPAASHAQKTVSGAAITGTMEIEFRTRLPQNRSDNGEVKTGVDDVYKVSLDAGSINIKGKIERTPTILSKYLGRVTQKGKIFYQLVWSFKNTYLGDWLGTVVTNDKGEYLWNGSGDPNSRPRILIQTVGNQAGFTDYFEGIMLGKGSQAGGSAKFLRKLSGGKVATYTSTNVDPMDFQNLILAKGPLGIYGRNGVNGKLVYDRESGSWITEDKGLLLTPEGSKEPDKVTGSIRWIEDPNRSSNGKGQYVFNLRWNEDRVPPSEETFSAGPVDEESFFAVDTSKPGLTGTIDYEDKLNSEGSPVYSKITFNLQANKMERSQIIAFLKLWLVGVGPLNDE